MKNNELCLPGDLLAIDGTNPAVGDEVELTNLKGKVTRVDGDSIYFQPTEANGKPLPAPMADNEEEEEAEEAAEPGADKLRQMAEKFDANN